jgi:two-component system copper resistance phosphate regulon response regulator CusR
VGYDGRAGWSLYASNTARGLVILDVNLPYLNGVELCRLGRPAPRCRCSLTALDNPGR